MRSKKSETPEGQELFAAVDASWIVLANGIQGLFFGGIGNILKHYKDIEDVTKIIFDDSYPVAHPLVAKQGFGSNFSQTDP